MPKHDVRHIKQALIDQILKWEDAKPGVKALVEFNEIKFILNELIDAVRAETELDVFRKEYD